MAVESQIGALALAIFMYVLFGCALYLLMLHPSRRHFLLSELVADFDVSIAITTLFVGTSSLVLWMSPQFVSEKHSAVPFIFWISGGTGLAVLLMRRLRRVRKQ